MKYQTYENEFHIKIRNKFESSSRKFYGEFTFLLTCMEYVSGRFQFQWDEANKLFLGDILD